MGVETERAPSQSASRRQVERTWHMYQAFARYMPYCIVTTCKGKYVEVTTLGF
jgi:hypothetical protein